MITFYPVAAMRVKDGHKVDLNADLYYVRATIFHPLLEADVSLPPHFWVFYRVGATNEFWTSDKSNAKGVCLIKGDPRALEKDAEYGLAFFPTPDDVRARYASDGAMWLSFSPTGVEWANPPPSLDGKLEYRNVVRLSQWTTMFKAKVGGGFAVVPPGASKFQERGTLKGSEVRPFGWPDVPWRIVLDEGWIRARVAHVFINRRTTKTELVPAGLMVQAWNDEGKVLGAGTMLPKKTAGTAEGTYLVIERPRSKWSEVNLAFRAPPNAWIDVRAAADAAPDRLSVKPIPAVVPPIPPYDPKVSTTMPELWYSDGMEVQVIPTPHGVPGGRKDWSEARKSLKDAVQPALIFCLDDVVLVDKEGSPATVAADTRTALFDQLLAIREPDPAEPIHSTLRLKGPMLRAGDVFPTDPPLNGAKHAFDRLTRLVYVQGTFYDLREKRVTGTPGKQKWIGLRAAAADDHAIGDYLHGNPFIQGKGSYELHFIDVPGVKDPETDAPIHHLLMSVGIVVVEDRVSAAEVQKLRVMLDKAAARWSPGHPGTRGLAYQNKKDYMLLTTDSVPDLRIRAYFGVDAKEHRGIKLVFVGEDGRANAPFGLHLGALELKAPKIIYFRSSLRDDETGTPVSTDLDGAGASWSTLAHELGHVLGLPDEYYDPFDPGVIDESLRRQYGEPTIAKFDEVKRLGTSCRPYYGDNGSQMKSNMLVRLRHFWHQAKALSEDPVFKASKWVPKGVYRPVHRSFGGAMLQYFAGNADKQIPYVPVGEGDLAGGRGVVTLFAVGHDEGTVSAMFAPTTGFPTLLAEGARFDAFAIVRVFVRFEFGSGIPIDKKWSTMRSLTEAGYEPRTHRLMLRIKLEPAAGKTAPYQRIAVFVHPHVAYGSGANEGVLCKITAGPPVGGVDPYFTYPLPSSVDVAFGDFNANAFLRVLLGNPGFELPKSARKIDRRKLSPMDFYLVATAVQTMLGLPMDTYDVKAIS